MAKYFVPPTPSQINLIAAGTHVEGSLNAKDDTRVSGSLKGTLRVDGKAIIAEEGSVEGEIHANDADLAGKLIGDIYVKGRLVLKETARIQGTIRTARLIVEEGAIIEGSCHMGQLDKSRADILKNGMTGNGAHASDKASPIPSAFSLVAGD
ncbi:MAG: polymer-forming cytoskeletal protein [Bacteroidetes bacterium]|nr:polymer-forming cytoskeletal protein [Bacteroidota bacterium]